MATRDAAVPGPMRWGRAILFVGVLAGAILVAGTVIPAVAPDTDPGILNRIGHFVNPDREVNVWSWLSASLLFALAGVFAVKAVATRAAGNRYGSYVFLAIVALLMSIDEATVLHEKFDELPIPGIGAARWLVIGIPAAILVGTVAVVLLRRTNPTLRRRLVVAGVVFLAGAVGVEFVQGFARGGPATPVANALEEGLEMAGVLLALWAALTDLAVRVGPDGLVVPPAR